MNFLEKDLEEIIFTSDKENLSKRGLFISKSETFKRQLKIGNYGIADLVSFKRPFYNPYENEVQKGLITVYELKKDRISISSFLQAATYLHGIKRYLKKRDLDDKYDYSIRLIGKDIDLQSSFVYLPELISGYTYDEKIDRPSLFYFSSYIYKYDIDGIIFKEIEGYSLINEGF